MPCYTVQTMSVTFKAQNAELLLEAVKSLGLRFTAGRKINITTRSGRIIIDLDAETAELSGSSTTLVQNDLNELKRAYSMEALKVIARKQHWSLKSKPSNKMAGVLQRRT
jgi:hypothetical protein